MDPQEKASVSKRSGAHQHTKPELRELYSMCGVLAKALLSHGTILREVMHRHGQFVVLTPGDHPGVAKSMEAKTLYFR